MGAQPPAQRHNRLLGNYNTNMEVDNINSASTSAAAKPSGYKDKQAALRDAMSNVSDNDLAE